jgi:hypothetical protein
MYRAARRVVRINRALTRGGTSDAAPHRTERDTMGELRVPAAALWGASTARAVANFDVSGVRMPAGVIRSLARIKVLAKRDAHGVRASQRARRQAAAAKANAELGVLPKELSVAIVAAAEQARETRSLVCAFRAPCSERRTLACLPVLLRRCRAAAWTTSSLSTSSKRAGEPRLRCIVLMASCFAAHATS